MKHAGRDALKALAPLLEALREREALKEKRPGVFYLKSRAFLHFHEDPAGYFADVRLVDDFDRMEVTTAPQRRALLRAIDEQIAASPPARTRSLRRVPEPSKR